MNSRYYKGLILYAASERVDHSIRGVQTDVCLIVCDLDMWTNQVTWAGFGELRNIETICVISIGV